MTVGKRIFDVLLALLLSVVLLPVLAGLCLWLLIRQGRPIFHVAERMKTPTQAFHLWKLRTMTVSTDDSGVTGGDKSVRITPAGAWLRRTRLDELPQLWNILRGDISFVGPRPPLREYVDRFPEIYAAVLRSRPGWLLWFIIVTRRFCSIDVRQRRTLTQFMHAFAYRPRHVWA